MPYDYFDPKHGTLARRLDVAFDVYFAPPQSDEESQMRAKEFALLFLLHVFDIDIRPDKDINRILLQLMQDRNQQLYWVHFHGHFTSITYGRSVDFGKLSIKQSRVGLIAEYKWLRVYQNDSYTLYSICER